MELDKSGRRQHKKTAGTRHRGTEKNSDQTGYNGTTAVAFMKVRRQRVYKGWRKP